MKSVHTSAPFSTSTPKRFRWRLQLTVMAIVSVATLVVLVVAQRHLESSAAETVRVEFEHSFEGLRAVQEFRSAALVERARELVEKLRVSTERDLRRRLYALGADVLADVLETNERPVGDHRSFHVEFFRFLDSEGEVIPPGALTSMHGLSAREEWALRLPGAPRDQPQLGCLILEKLDEDGPLYDLIALPVAIERGERYVATLVLGLESARFPEPMPSSDSETSVGLWSQGRLFLTNLPVAERKSVADAVTGVLARQSVPARPMPVNIAGTSRLLLMQCLNPNSSYPPVYEVGVFSMEKLRATRWRLRWQVLGTGGVVLLLALGLTRAMAARFSRPVEELVLVSAENRARRLHAEEALALTTEGLRRAARFSADASHQLKTPVAVMRTGLEELLAQESLSPQARIEVESLIKQTGRLSALVDDLLLLSRMDAGRLEISFSQVDLVQLVAAELDDLSTRADPLQLRVETDWPAELPIHGEARYVVVLVSNLIENAAKYNRPAGRIRVTAVRRGLVAELRIANTARTPIPISAQRNLFDRFHRGAMGEDVPGYGLGLNLARELARLHGGDLELVRSDSEWTEFLVRFKAA